MNAQKIIEFIDELLKSSFDVASGSIIKRLDRQRTQCWATNALEILRLSGLNEHSARASRILVGTSAYSGDQILEAAGVLESARDCLQRGFVGNLRHLLHAEVFTSTVEQAKESLTTGHVIPAAVLGRIVIESWLRDQGEKESIPGREKLSASQINDRLKTAGVFPQPKWRQIQAHLDTGNAAAHGDTSKFMDADVQRMLDFAEANCV